MAGLKLKFHCDMSLILTCILLLPAAASTSATIGNDEIANDLAESLSAYAKTHKFVRATELFSCGSSIDAYLHVAKCLMAKGFYCNVNLMDASSNIEIRLSSISSKRHEHQTMVIVDASCTTGGERLLKAVRVYPDDGVFGEKRERGACRI
jgi:hypothetical protein